MMTLKDLINLPDVSLDSKILVMMKDEDCYDHFFNIRVENGNSDFTTIYLELDEEED